MKRNYLNVLLAVVSSVAFFSCSDTDEPIQQITEESVVKTDQEALAFANGVYPPLQRLSSSYSFLLESASESTISFEGTEDEDGPLVSRFETNQDNWYPTKIFNYLYVSVGEANRTIEKVDSSYAGGNLTQATLDLARARVKFVRALDYLYLAQLWGEVPLILSTNATPAERTTRKSIDDVYAQIVKDLTEAEEGLPAFDNIRSNPSKGAANAILARAYLTWASNPLTQNEIGAIANGQTDPAAPAWNTERLQKAVEYADKVIDSGQFKLENDFEKNFGVSAENQSLEHIFTIHHDGDNQGDAQGNHQTHCPFTWRFDLYQDNHIGPADATLVDRFSDSDKRKRFSIATQLYNIDEKVGNATPDVVTNYEQYDYVFPVTAPRYAKFIHRSPSFVEAAYSTEDGQPNNINRIEIRYAEVLLIKAEALFFLGKANEALTLINQLRSRAGISNLSALTQADLEREWDLELFFEQKHWQNLVRWRKLIQTVLTVEDFEYYKDDYKDEESIAAKFGPATETTNYPFFAKVHKHLHAKYHNVNGKFYRFPIPKGLSGNDLGITQNPGY
ncbi:RagB/SusD family nutrient uptake outer membrane protein [termite gut metagenome]|uniref:RagB/SusD family nutrient uptake outer membrane protein n=1 Tax=termite gut metagenome TaxID=433724 RepID=A0A5J4S8G3_9ZZZZ